MTPRWPNAEAANRRQTWGTNVRVQRERIGMTQKQLAHEIGVSVQAVSAWENGMASPTPERQFVIAEALHTAPTVLFPLNGGAS